MAPGSREKWWWAYFTHHPGHTTKKPEAFMGTGNSAKPKAYCTQCFAVNIAQYQRQDQHDINIGRRVNPRSQEQIEIDLWMVESNNANRGWLRGVASTLLHHLQICEHQSSDIRAQAAEDRHGQGSSSGPGSTARRLRSRRDDLHIDTGVAQQTIILNSPAAASSSSSFSHPQSVQGSPLLSYHSNLHSASPAPFVTSHPNSRAPSRSSSCSYIGHIGSIPQPTATEWNAASQQRFEDRIMRLTASAGLPFNWVDNPEWIGLVDEFIPAAKSPSRKTLGRTILTRAVSDLRAVAKNVAKGNKATIQADGLTAMNHHHLVAIMITIEGKVYTVKVHDTSTERKTAENFEKILEDAIKTVENDWGAVAVAIVTDASGECRKAKRCLSNKYKSIAFLDCYSHQVNLIVGDYFKSQVTVLEYTDKATELISWLRSKTLVLGLLREVREQANLSPLTVIRAVLTRWTAHYMAYRRLLELQGALAAVVSLEEARPQHAKMILVGDKKAVEKSKDMFAVIKDAVFWHSILRMKRHLEPLALAANVTQAVQCHLDQVLLMFGYLVMKYQELMRKDPEDTDACMVIMESIEKRWVKADQELFIAAVILNPFFRSSPFANLPFLNNAGIHALFEGLWTRFYSSNPPEEFDEGATDYLSGTGTFQAMQSRCEHLRFAAEKKGESPNPLALYDQFCFIDTEPSPFIKFAKQILSICANSASCERLFSVFGNTLTKLRNCLGTDKLQALAELQMHIRDENRQSKDKKDRLKRHFVASAKPPAAAEPVPAPTGFAFAATSFIQPPIMSPAPTAGNSMEINAPSASAVPPTPAFRQIAEHHWQLALEDDEDNAAVHIPELLGRPIEIRKLFNFDRVHWVETYMKSANHSFDEELDLYQLLDMDGEGEEDIDINVDDITADILLS